jgi:SRSO17 transposase
VIGVEAWVLDDTGFVKDGKRSPGVKRQYSGTLGKIGNCQLGVSLHAVGERGTLPLGWALYLPEEWCADLQRRRAARIPDDVVFKTKPQLGVDLVEQAVGWGLVAAPVLGDQAYGDNTALRERLHDAGREYVLAVGAQTTVYAPETTFVVPPRTSGRGRPPSRARADREPEAIKTLIARLGRHATQTVRFRDGPDATPMTSQFLFVRVRAAHDVAGRQGAPREQWLIAQWPDAAKQPLDYLISNLPIDAPPERLARLAGLRCKIELDYRQLKGELGLDHYEGALLAGLASPHRAGHGRARLSHIGADAPKSPAAGLTLPKAVLLLQPLRECWTGRCHICQRPIDLNDLILTTPYRHHE